MRFSNLTNVSNKVDNREVLSFTYSSGFSNSDAAWITQIIKKNSGILIKMNFKCSTEMVAGTLYNVLTVGSDFDAMRDVTTTAISSSRIPVSVTLYASGVLGVVPASNIPANTSIMGSIYSSR